eukprot:TRINITY_DN658_c0_g3_i1.p1 TRINITY_DN658_c0_g3~~TRINITY_DN658_c0_g3_i1.p1  ORF type:complete len:690 (-),score=166.37 TRINITY_DN658_c0_g3_i1:1913-3982(-)
MNSAIRVFFVLCSFLPFFASALPGLHPHPHHHFAPHHHVEEAALTQTDESLDDDDSSLAQLDMEMREIHAKRMHRHPVPVPQDVLEREVVAMLRKRDQSSSLSSYELRSWVRVLLKCLGLLLAIFLLSTLVWLYKETPPSQFCPGGSLAEDGEGKSLQGDENDAFLLEEPKEEQAATLVDTEEAPPQTRFEDLEEYENLARKTLQKGAQIIGPKVTKGVKIAGIVSEKAFGLTDKARRLAVTELTDTTASVAKALGMEELMLLLDPEAALSANFPQSTVLFAGLMVPVNFWISLICHGLNIGLVMLPVLGVAFWAEYYDHGHTCSGMPSAQAWSRSVALLAIVISVSRIGLMKKIMDAQAKLAKRSEEMREKLVKAEAEEKEGGTGLEEIQQLLMHHTTILQYAVVCDNEARRGPMVHAVGAGTLLWILTMFWNLDLYFRYLFVPGVVNFNPDFSWAPSYCGAVVTACAIKISIVLSLMFLIPNVVTVVSWIADCGLKTEGSKKRILDLCKGIDRFSLGMPIAETCAKAFLFNGATDTLEASYQAGLLEQLELSQELADTEARLQALKQKIEEKDAECDHVKETLLSADDEKCTEMADQLSRSAANFKSSEQRGEEVIAEARRRAAELSESTNEEIEKVISRIKDVMNQAKEQGELFAAQAQEQGATLAAQAQEQGAILAAQAQEKVAA